MRKVPTLLWLLLARQIAFAQSLPEKFIYPAEFDRMEAIWMTWSTYTADNKGEAERIMLEMAKAITPAAKLHLFVENDSVRYAALSSLLRYGVDTSRVKCFYTPVQNRFVRDIGPLFLRGDQGHLKGIDFGYNCYGYCDANSEDARYYGTLDSLTETKMGLPVVKTSICGEGGAHEFNGKGTMIVVEAVELNRNPGMTKPQLETEYKRLFGVKKVIWLKKGTPEDDKVKDRLPCGVWSAGTGGHIDEFCRFADAHTILLAGGDLQDSTGCDSLIRINQERMMENYHILASASDQDGKPFTIVRVPVADYLFRKQVVSKRGVSFFKGAQEGDSLTMIYGTSYLNFVIANEVVLIPKYYKAGRPVSSKTKDEQALRIFERVFPGRRVVQIEVSEFNTHYGGMHCATQNQPAVATTLGKDH